MPSVPIGRRELFAFAERHTGRKVTVYATLADGEVLCELFNIIFPRFAIPRIDASIHSTSVRARMYWEMLFRRCARLYIPLTLLQPRALSANDTEVGFATMVLFYFLYQLKRRADFTAEFNERIKGSVLQYLQSVNSIASLVLGEAVEWATLSTHLAECVSALPAFHVSPQERLERDEAAVMACHAALGLSLVSLRASSQQRKESVTNSRSATTCWTVEAQSSGWALVDGNDRSTSTPTMKRSVSDLFDVSPDEPTCSTVDNQLPYPYYMHIKANETGSLTEESNTSSECSDNCLLDCSRRRPRDQMLKQPFYHQPATAATPAFPSHSPLPRPKVMSDEMESAEMYHALYTEQLRHTGTLEKELQRWRSSHREAVPRACAASTPVMTTSTSCVKDAVPVTCLRRPCEELLVSALSSSTSDVAHNVCAASALCRDLRKQGAVRVVDFHACVDELHALLAKYSQEHPVEYTQAQHHLWVILSAYHTLETRLDTAVTIVEKVQSCMRNSLDVSPTDTCRGTKSAVCALNELRRAVESTIRDAVTQQMQYEQAELALLAREEGLQ